MKKAELRELQELWARAVLLDDGGRPRPCWFSLPPEHDYEDYGPCGGERGPDFCEGAHWISRQAVENVLWFPLQAFQYDDDPLWHPIEPGFRQGLINLAAWDPRNGVPACEWHHRHFDQHLVAKRPLVVYRPFVPVHVEEFVAERGLETPLEVKCPDLPADWADV